jgi:hypothetical protein
MWPCVPRLHLRKFGATTCSRMTFGRTAFCIATPRKMIMGKTKHSPMKEKLTLSRMTFGRMTLSRMIHIRRTSVRMTLSRMIPKGYVAE